MPVVDVLVARRSRAAVGEAVRRDAEVRAVDVSPASSGRPAPGRRRRWQRRTTLVERASTCAACRCPACRPRRARATVRHGAIDVNCAICRSVGEHCRGRRIHRAVQVLPVTALSGSARSAGRRGWCCTRRRRRCRSGPAPGSPGRTRARGSPGAGPSRGSSTSAAVVRAEDAARADAVVELAGGEHDVRVRRIDLDHVVVEHCCRSSPRRCRRRYRPAAIVQLRSRVRRLEDARRVLAVASTQSKPA